MTTMYLAKYAISSGKIQEVDASELRASTFEDGYFWHAKLARSYTIGRDIFKTREEAVGVVNADVAKKIKSLQKQIAKLEALKF